MRINNFNTLGLKSLEILLTSTFLNRLADYLNYLSVCFCGLSPNDQDLMARADQEHQSYISVIHVSLIGHTIVKGSGHGFDKIKKAKDCTVSSRDLLCKSLCVTAPNKLPTTFCCWEVMSQIWKCFKHAELHCCGIEVWHWTSQGVKLLWTTFFFF